MLTSFSGSATIASGQMDVCRTVIYGNGYLAPSTDILLVQRAANAKRDAGAWELPGGQAEPGESLDEAAAREALQEVGLHINLTTAPELIHSRTMRGGKYDGTPYRAHRFLATVANGSHFHLDTDELQSAVWLPRRRALALGALTLVSRNALQQLN